jgi:YidC/Oxa1 family membrane protein insertase
MIHLASVLQTLSATTTAATKSSGGSILDPIAKPLGWILAGIYSVVPDYGVAILGLSIIWMVIISPLTLKSTRSMLAMQRLQPELKKLQEKHRNDKQAFAQAQMDLFREHNVSPFGSCLPMILPLPVFFALYRVIDGLSHTIKVNGAVVAAPKYIDVHTAMYKAIQSSHGKLEAFGMNLAQSALSHHSGIVAAAPYWITLVIMGATSYFQSAMMMSRNQAAANANPQMRMMKYIAPLFALISIRFPAGVVVYYATSNLCRILQQDAMYRFDPKVKALVVQEVAEVEELTQEIEDREKTRPGYTPPRGAKPPPPARPAPAGRSGKGGDGSNGRSRFRDLLAAAAEQQRTQQDAKAGRNEAKPGSDGGGDGNGAGDARADRRNGGRADGATGTGSSGNGNGKSSAANRNRSGTGGTKGGQGGRNRSGSRTNRKRRGR